MARKRCGGWGYTAAIVLGCGGATEQNGGAGGTYSSAGAAAGGSSTSSGGASAGTTGSASGGSSANGPFKPTGGAWGRGGTESGAGAPSCDPFVACPCGCCPGTTTDTPTDCFYPDYGVSRDVAIVESRASATTCSPGMCSFARLYGCCRPLPNDAAKANRYAARYVDEFGGRIEVRREDDRGDCISFELTSGPSELVSLSSKALRWNGQGQYGPCDASSSSSSTPRAIGIEGTIETVASPSGCTLNIHTTLFLGLRNLLVLAVPMHVDALEADLPTSFCASP